MNYNLKQRRNALQFMTKLDLKILCEIMYNLYMGTFKTTVAYINDLQKHKRSIQLLVDKKTSSKKRRAILVKSANNIQLFLRPIQKLLT